MLINFLSGFIPYAYSCFQNGEINRESILLFLNPRSKLVVGLLEIEIRDFSFNLLFAAQI